jgi:hypothetical protein
MNRLLIDLVVRTNTKGRIVIVAIINARLVKKNRRISGIVFDVKIIGPLLFDSTIARTRNGRPEYKLAHDA